VAEEAIAELLAEEKIGVMTDQERVHMDMAELRKEKELQHGKNAGSGVEHAKAANFTPSDLTHAASPSLQFATLDPIRAGRAGKYSDTGAPSKNKGELQPVLPETLMSPGMPPSVKPRDTKDALGLSSSSSASDTTSQGSSDSDPGNMVLGVWLDWATIRFRFFGPAATYTGGVCVFGPALSSPAHALISLDMR
jgi:hypothetical protein